MSQVRLSDRRALLKEPDCDAYGIDVGDVIRVILVPDPSGDDPVMISLGDSVVRTDRRITVGKEIYEVYDIDRDHVDLWFLQTGVRHPDYD